jgi:hypothetical protein
MSKAHLRTERGENKFICSPERMSKAHLRTERGENKFICSPERRSKSSYLDKIIPPLQLETVNLDVSEGETNKSKQTKNQSQHRSQNKRIFQIGGHN